MNDQFPGDHKDHTHKPTDITGGVKETLREAKEKIMAKSKEAATQAKERGEEYAREGKEQAAERIGNVSESVRQTADRLENDQNPNIAHYTRLLADKLEHVATYVRQRDLNQLRNDTEDLGRRYPTLFLGSLFVAGLAAARFLKASSARDQFSCCAEDGKKAAQNQRQEPAGFPEGATGNEQKPVEPINY